MTVYVRVTTGEDEMDEHTSNLHETASSRRTRPDDGDSMMPPTRDHRQASRPSSRPAPRQSHSPQPGRGRRSESASTNNKHRVRTAAKGRATSSHGSFVDPTADGYHSDSDGGGASVTSSRRGKKEQVASAEISVENIVEGGRRKRAKFDSSVSIVSTLAVDMCLTKGHAGTSTVHPTSGSNVSFHLVNFSAETDQRSKWCFTIFLLESANLCFFPLDAVAP
jgi:hypothetical protein